MTMTELRRDQVHGDDETPTGPLRPVDPPAPQAAGPAPTVLDRMGGPMGFVYSTVPVVVFVTADALLSLPVTIGVSIAVGLGLTGFRLLRGEGLSSALGSVIGVAVAAGVVAWTGSAKDFFVIGIWASLAGFVVTAGSLLARRPLTGLAWNAVHGGTHAWRSDRVVRRAHDIATIAAAAVFGARFAVQQWLYVIDTTGGLAVAKVAMGTPLTVLGALVVFWAFRRSTKRLVVRS